MFAEDATQYWLVGALILLVVAIKYFAVQRSYQRKLHSFIHPHKLLEEVRPQIGAIDDVRAMLALNLSKVATEPARLRNICVMLAYLHEKGIPLQPLRTKINSEFGKLAEESLDGGQIKYRDYALKAVEGSI